MGTRLILSVLYASAIQFGWAGAIDYKLFSVSKDVNENYVQYMAAVESDCSFRESDPIWMHWMIKDGQNYRREDLNVLEKNLYGIKVSSQSGGRIDGIVRALDQKADLPLTVTSSKGQHGCDVKSFVGGKQMPAATVITDIELKKFNGPRPTEVSVKGVSVNGKKVNQTIGLR